jgi:hypothetical protein
MSGLKITRMCMGVLILNLLLSPAHASETEKAHEVQNTTSPSSVPLNTGETENAAADSLGALQRKVESLEISLTSAIALYAEGKQTNDNLLSTVEDLKKEIDALKKADSANKRIFDNVAKVVNHQDPVFAKEITANALLKCLALATTCDFFVNLYKVYGDERLPTVLMIWEVTKLTVGTGITFYYFAKAVEYAITQTGKAINSVVLKNRRPHEPE